MKTRDLILLIFLNVIWGSAFAAGGYAMAFVSPIFLYSLRFLLVGVLTAPFYKFPREEIKNIIIVSCLQALCFVGIALSVKNLDSSLVAIVTRLDVVFTILLAAIFFNEKISIYNILGLIICFLAVYIIFGNMRIYNFKDLLILLLAIITSSVANIFIKKIKNADNLSLISWNSLFMGIIMLIIALIFEDKYIINKNFTLDFYISFLYLSIFSSFLAYVAFYYLLRNNETSKIMPYNFIKLLVSIMAGYLILNEPITLEKIIGSILIIVGIAVSQIKKKI